MSGRAPRVAAICCPTRPAADGAGRCTREDPRRRLTKRRRAALPLGTPQGCVRLGGALWRAPSAGVGPRCRQSGTWLGRGRWGSKATHGVTLVDNLCAAGRMRDAMSRATGDGMRCRWGDGRPPSGLASRLPPVPGNLGIPTAGVNWILLGVRFPRIYRHDLGEVVTKKAPVRRRLKKNK